MYSFFLFFSFLFLSSFYFFSFSFFIFLSILHSALHSFNVSFVVLSVIPCIYLSGV